MKIVIPLKKIFFRILNILRVGERVCPNNFQKDLAIFTGWSKTAVLAGACGLQSGVQFWMHSSDRWIPLGNREDVGDLPAALEAW